MQVIELEKKYWREVFRPVTDIIVFLSTRDLVLLRHDEIIGSFNNGNLLGIIELLSKYDPFLTVHIKNMEIKGMETYRIYFIVFVINWLILWQRVWRKWRKFKSYCEGSAGLSMFFNISWLNLWYYTHRPVMDNFEVSFIIRSSWQVCEFCAIRSHTGIGTAHSYSFPCKRTQLTSSIAVNHMSMPATCRENTKAFTRGYRMCVVTLNSGRVLHIHWIWLDPALSRPTQQQLISFWLSNNFTNFSALQLSLGKAWRCAQKHSYKTQVSFCQTSVR